VRPRGPVAAPAAVRRLGDLANQRSAAGLRRRLHPRDADAPLLDLAGNDYLGLASHPAVVDAGVAALRTWGAGSTGSRLVTGTTALHSELEAALAAHVGAEAALVFSSGYTANLGVVSALAGPGTLVVSDERNHASLIDACRLSRAEVAIVAHRSVPAVEAALRARPAGQAALVLTDAIFSADGDPAPLAELAATCRAFDALLVIDDAHGLGVVGRGGCGAAAAAGLAGAADVVITATLSKALGGQGGAVLGPGVVIDHLVDTARPFIFDTGLAPASAGTALAALDVLRDEPERAERVRSVAGRVATGLGLPAPSAAVIPVLLGEPHRAVQAAAACARDGLLVGCFRPPSVPVGTSRLRLTARADLTDDEVALAVKVVSSATGK
jgi:8-amino-7-oxononanoate synthase